MSIATFRGRLVAVVMLVFVAGVVAAILAWCSRTPEAVRANEAILASLPVYPSAIELERRHTPYNFSDGVSFLSPAAGWGTSVTYRPPAGTTAEDIRAFYESALSDRWQQRVDRTRIMELSGAIPPSGSTVTVTPPPDPVQIGVHELVSFCRGDARVSLELDNLDQLGTFRVGVDASWSAPGHREC